MTEVFKAVLISDAPEGWQVGRFMPKQPMGFWDAVADAETYMQARRQGFLRLSVSREYWPEYLVMSFAVRETCVA